MVTDSIKKYGYNEISEKKINPILKFLIYFWGLWSELAARKLVSGDVVRVRLGNIIHEDIKLFSDDYLSVDESVLTDESLSVEKYKPDFAYKILTIFFAVYGWFITSIYWNLALLV